MPLPAQRTPIPVIAGNAPVVRVLDTIRVEIPSVGTAWNLTGFSLTTLFTVVSFLNAGTVTLEYEILLSGDVIDRFTQDFDVNASAVGGQQTHSDFHSYNPGFIVFDTNELAIRFISDTLNGPTTLSFDTALQWRGQAAYL